MQTQRKRDVAVLEWLAPPVLCLSPPTDWLGITFRELALRSGEAAAGLIGSGIGNLAVMSRV